MVAESMALQDPEKAAIRNVLLILGSAVLIGALFVTLLVNYYGPSGRYVAGHVIVAPDVLEHVAYEQPNPATGNITRYVYDSVDFTYYHPVKQDMAVKELDPFTYKQLYALLQQDTSTAPVVESVEELFADPHIAYLTLWVRPEESTGSIRPLYRIYFPTASSLYRVERVQDVGDESPWIYFFHDNIYKKVLELTGAGP